MVLQAPPGPGQARERGWGQAHTRGDGPPRRTAHTYRAIAEDGLPDVYVIVGPDHYGTARGRTVLCSEDFSTPLGVCRTDSDVCSRLVEVFPDDPGAHSMEHAVEVQVPFIQSIDPDPSIVAVTMGDQSPEAAVRLAKALGAACEGVDAVVIASTDMSHYIPKADAARLDGMVLDRVSEMDVGGMYRTVYENRVSMCGYGPTAVAMIFSEGSSAEVLKHTDSFDALGMDPTAVVGYASAVFRA